jgi:hypothetical protein
MARDATFSVFYLHTIKRSIVTYNTPEKEIPMFRLTAVIFIMVATVLMGGAVTAVLATPSLEEDIHRWIPISVGLGALLALPISYVVANLIQSQSRKR